MPTDSRRRKTIRCVPDCDGTKSTFYDAFQEPDWERHRRGVFINGTSYKLPSRPKYNWELAEDTRGYEDLSLMYEEINTMSNLQITYNLITGINLLMLFVRFLLLLKFQPRLAIITKTFERSTVDILHFLVVYIIFMAMAAVLGNTMFGHSIECVSSVPSAFELLFCS